MPKDELPDDLVEFLESDRRLTYDVSACEIGVFAFRSLDELEQIDLAVRSEDHASACSIRAWDLLKSCEYYDPRGMLVYIPSLRKFGSYDSEREGLITYRGMSWSDFLANPARYINAAWAVDDEIAEATFSEAEVDRIVDVCSTAHGIEAQALAAMLQGRGIRSQAVGEDLGIAGVMLPFGQSIAPRVWVREGDVGRAREMIEECMNRPSPERSGPAEIVDEEGESAGRAELCGAEDISFCCQECGSRITFSNRCRGHVEECPNCGNYVDVPARTETIPPTGLEHAASPPASMKAAQAGSPGSGSRTRTELWIEVIAVLCLAYLPYIFAAIWLFLGSYRPERSFTHQALFLIIMSLQVAMPVLVIMALCGDSWRLFGIVRPKWFTDVGLACVIWWIAIVAHNLVMPLLPRSILESMASLHAAHRARPEGIAGFFLLLVSEGANGFSEELVMRAYLIARLQRLLSSTSSAVVITTVLFASYHIYEGVAGMVGAAVTGFVMALGFCWFRRLWPLCMAHALWNILVTL